MKSWKVWLCCGLLLLPVLLTNPHWLLSTVFPLSKQSIRFDEVDLGALEPGEKRLAMLEVHNDSWQNIELTSIQSDCGCVVVQAAPRRLSSRSSKTIEFSLQAPATPGKIERSLVFGVANAPNLAWQVAITGRVEAEVWAEPARLDLKLSLGETAEQLMAVKHETGFPLGEIKSTTEKVRVIDTWPVENGCMVKLAIQNMPERHQTPMQLYVYKQDDPQTPCLVIPIRCQPRPVVTFTPVKLNLSSIDASSPTVRNVVVTLLKATEDQPPSFEPIVPWVTARTKAINSSTYQVTLTVDIKNLSILTEEPILQVELPSGESAEMTAFFKK